MSNLVDCSLCKNNSEIAVDFVGTKESTINTPPSYVAAAGYCERSEAIRKIYSAS